MRIVLDTRKTVEQNAADYFERAKKAKRKLEGARKAVLLAQSKLSSLDEEAQAREAADAAVSAAAAMKRPVRKREWYERLRWFLSSDEFLCIGGRDASTNEVVVKRHAQPGDVVFHTDMAGSPFIVVKSDGKEVPASTKEEAAQFCAVYCRAWKLGLAMVEVFSVAPEQLSKEPNSGEFLPKGAFVVRGKVSYYNSRLEVCVGKLPDGRVMAAPQLAVLYHCGRGHMVLQGNEKSSDVAKRLAKSLDAEVDDIIAVLPPGGVKLGKEITARSASSGG
jgi:predicted ribosome quality control (RQC) complex YloA/Tae2 family protein